MGVNLDISNKFGCQIWMTDLQNKWDLNQGVCTSGPNFVILDVMGTHTHTHTHTEATTLREGWDWSKVRQNQKSVWDSA